jgi:predicted DNA-binding ribbon-helix-helix protein
MVGRRTYSNIGDRRTSLRLEPIMWDALADIARREGMSLHDVCAMVEERRQASSLTAAIRVFVLAYFRAAATEDGHAAVGHGTLYGAPRRGRSARHGR